MIKAEVMQTKLGEILKGWEICSLGDVAYFSNGKSSPERSDSFNYEVFGSNGIIGRAAQYNSTEGTVIVGRVGSYCGSVYFSKNKCWVTDNAIIGLPRENSAAGFLYYLLLNLDLNNHRSGSGQPLLNQGILNSINVSIPLLKEQRAIAKILSDLDEKIELNHRMNKTLEVIAQAIFKQWFVDFNFPDEKGRPYKDSGGRMIDAEFGEIPVTWYTGTFSEVAENPRRGVAPNEIEPSTGYIGLEHMPRHCIALSNWGLAEGLESNKSAFQAGEILFGKLRPYFHKVGVAPLDGVCSTDILVVVPKNPEWFGFVLGHISSVDFVNHTSAGSTGTRMPRTNWQDMADYKMPIPQQTLAESFSEHVKPLIARIIANIHQSRTLVDIRDSLLPKLISGKIRLENFVGAKL